MSLEHTDDAQPAAAQAVATMKVVVVGASGNVGTALLHAMREDDRFQRATAIARRLPDESVAPYDAAEWTRIDIAMPAVDDVDENRIIDQLAAAFEGADAVVHLAWLIQPNRDRTLIRRANVDGTRRVVEACLKAGVGHLVCASSVGAYSPVDDDAPRDESWATRGIRSSHYSVDKAAQERVLDGAEDRGLAVARVRAALVFDAAAGAEVTRLFLGGLVPPALLRPGALPVVPLPTGLRMQVVHGADLADAYLRIILRRATGAFNVAAEPVLHQADIADVLGRGRYVSVPAKTVRPLLAAAWRVHAVAADAGWLDVAMGAPVMDTTRAQHELDWRPRRDARAALREMVTAMADGTGAHSAPKRPRGHWPQDQAPPGGLGADGRTDQPIHASRIPASIERDIFALYLSDHLTGATAGAERISRMAKAYANTDMSEALRQLAIEIRGEREFLAQLIDTLQVPQRPHRQFVAWAAEKAGRLKFNGRASGSPMTPVLEIELMRSAINGKLGLWETLAALAPDLGMPPETFTALIEQGRAQVEVLEQLHARVAPRAFRG